MKDKILAFLKTKLQGVQESFLLGVAEHYAKTITDETKIEATLTDGVIDLLKLNAEILQKEGDKRATEASKTALKTFQEKHGLDENGKPIEDPSKKGPGRPAKKDVDPDEPAWFKEYREKKDIEYAELKTKLEKAEKDKTSALLTEKVRKHDKLKDIPASFLKGRNLAVESEDKIDQLVTELETDWNAFKQEQAEKGVIISVPSSSTETIKEGAEIGKKIAEKKNAKSSDGVKGKKI